MGEWKGKEDGLTNNNCNLKLDSITCTILNSNTPLHYAIFHLPGRHKKSFFRGKNFIYSGSFHSRLKKNTLIRKSNQVKITNFESFLSQWRSLQAVNLFYKKIGQITIFKWFQLSTQDLLVIEKIKKFQWYKIILLSNLNSVRVFEWNYTRKLGYL